MEILEQAQIAKGITGTIEYALDTCGSEKEEDEVGEFLIERGFKELFIKDLIRKRRVTNLFN